MEQSFFGTANQEGLSDPDIIFPALPDGYTFLPRLLVATETIAAFHCNIVEYNMLRAFGHPARLRRVGCSWFKFENCQGGQTRVAYSTEQFCDMLLFLTSCDRLARV